MPVTLPFRRTTIASLAVLLVCAAAVGAMLLRGASADAKTSRTASLKAAANGDLKFNTKTLTVTHGKVSLTMSNPKSSGTEHAIALDGHGVDKDGKTAEPGSTSKVTATLKKGTYTYYCPIPGHRAAGMKGKLTVK